MKQVSKFRAKVMPAILIAGFFLFTNLIAAQAATLTVTTTADANDGVCDAADCSLREAIAAAAPGDTVEFSALFDAAQTITLTNGELSISKSLTIAGKGANLTTVSGNNASRVFSIAQSPVNVTISGLTIANGNGNGSDGGGVRNLSTGTVNLTDCAFTNNNSSTGYGGGIEDRSPGGGTLNIAGCTFSGNTAREGGAIKLQHNTTNVTNTTISGNTANDSYGGGIANYESTLVITSSTITGNTTTGSRNSSAAGGVSNISAQSYTTVKNSIIAGNTGNSGANPDIGIYNTGFISNGYNFIGVSNGSIGFTHGVNSDQVGTAVSPRDPLLATLADNGGPTRTHAPFAGSPAIDKGFSFGFTTDQRGLTRPVEVAAYANAIGGDGSDIGAFEGLFAPVTLTVTTTADANDGVCDAADCSLREAIAAAAPGDTVEFSALFDAAQTITLTNGELSISKSLTIAGKGANLTTVSGNNASRVFSIAQSPVNVTISGLTIANGNGNGSDGGGVRNLSTGTVNLTDCAFTNNNSSTGYGGGIEDRSPGGGTLNIAGCTFSGNTAREGGAIKLQHNTTNVTNTTISGNTANDSYGGGIANYESTLVITSSTITGNTTTGSRNSSAAGGVSNISAQSYTTVKNSIIAGNTGNSGANPDIGIYNTGFISNGYNFIGVSNGSIGFTHGVNSDQVGTAVSPRDPLLATLADNGGPTRTHAPFAGSPAIDHGDATGTDQRGFVRSVDDPAAANGAGNLSDIGAFEVQRPLSTGVCPWAQGDWKNNPRLWPVSSLTIGGREYSQAELIAILKMPTGTGKNADASLILAGQLIAAKLNVANGTDLTADAISAIAEAEALLSTFNGFLPYRVKPSSATGQSMVNAAKALEAFNKGSTTVGCSIV